VHGVGTKVHGYPGQKCTSLGQKCTPVALFFILFLIILSIILLIYNNYNKLYLIG
jgi:hypothetical protein